MSPQMIFARFYTQLLIHRHTHHNLIQSGDMAEDSLQFRFMRGFHEMDHASQAKAEKFFKGFIIVIAILSYLVAWQLQQFSICVYSTLGSMVVSYFVVIPGQVPWWRNPLPDFRPAQEREKAKKK